VIMWSVKCTMFVLIFSGCGIMEDIDHLFLSCNFFWKNLVWYL